MPTARRIAFALKSLRIIARALDKLPHSLEKADVLDGALECMETVERWRQQPPTDAENEQIMSRLLKLHLAAVKLPRG